MEQLFAPFYVGQKVIGNPAYPRMVRNGKIYTITNCHLSINPANGTGPYWYVGATDCKHDWLAPYLFLPIKEDFISISLEEILKEETQLISSN